VRHLENLQRKGGFKGFNQHTVSLIIPETDPRKQGAKVYSPRSGVASGMPDAVEGDLE